MDELKDQRQEDADHEAGDDRKIKAEPVLADTDVSRQVPKVS